VAVTVLLFGGLGSAQEPDFSKVAGNVYLLQGAGGNIGASVGDDGL